MRIQAAVINERGGAFAIEEVELDAPQPTEVLVRVVASGICQTDLHARDGYFPIPAPAVVGHEGVGIVETVGSGVRSVQPGDRVVMVSPSCGDCANCRADRSAYCLALPGLKMNGVRADGSSTLHRGGQKLGGSFFQQSSLASHALATERNVVKVPENVDLEVLASMPCGVSTGAGAAINVLGARPGLSFAVLGTGAVGLAGLMAAKDAGCAPIVAVDIKPNRLALARELGATHALDGSDPDLVGELLKITAGRGVQAILDTTAVPEMVKRSVDALAMLGIYCLVGSARGGVEASFEMRVLQYGRTIRGCIQGDGRPHAFIPELIARYRAGRFPMDRLVTRYAFADINRAAADLESGRTIKPVVCMPQGA